MMKSTMLAIALSLAAMGAADAAKAKPKRAPVVLAAQSTPAPPVTPAIFTPPPRPDHGGNCGR